MLEIKGNKRGKRESFAKYRTRLKKEKEDLKLYLKGGVIWQSGHIRDKEGKVVVAGKGTYVRSLHGAIGTV